jgi:hypothetical protein
VCFVTASKSSVLPWKLTLYKIYDETCFLIAAENDIRFKVPGVKWPGHDVDHLLLSSTEVKNYLFFCCMPSWHGQGQLYFFFKYKYIYIYMCVCVIDANLQWNLI